MTITLSDRTNNIQPSPTLAINARAKQLAAKGGDIISLSVGEPDFDTPQHIKDAASKAMQDGLTKYTAVDGTPFLKQAIINKFERDNELKYEPNQIIVSSGAKQSLFNLATALLNPGDEVIIPAPYWASYPDIAIIADAKPIIVMADLAQDYKITPEQLEEAITDKTRLFIMNSPSNPSGMVYTRAELTALAEVLVKHPQIVIVSDDIYEHILWTHRPFSNLVNVCPELADRTVVVNGVSKAYSMTGWRIGYAAGPTELIAGMKKVQSQSTSNPNSIAQYAAQAALESDQQCVTNMVKEFKSRHDFLLQGLKNIDGVECVPSNGTFYTFPDVSKVIERLPGINDDLELSEHLLTKAGVAVVPGSAFGVKNTLRLSFAVSTETLDDALKRMKIVMG